MDQRLTRIEEQLARLRADVAHLEQRIASLECRRESEETAAAGVVGEPADAATPEERIDTAASWVLRAVSLAGRSLLVFAGAYLLRALTDNGTLPAAAGVGLGLAYALGWLVAAARAREAMGAAFHGGTATLVAFPLVIEATLRFNLFTPSESAVVLAVLTGVSGFAAWWTHQRPLAWMTATASVVAGVALAVRGDATGPFALHFILLGIAALWLGYDREWTMLRWPAALVADVFVVGLTTRALNPELGQSPWMALGAQFVLLAGYLTSIAVRTIVRGRGVIPFEVVQTVAALGVGLGGAIAVTGTLETGTVALGAASCLMGAATYAVAFLWVERRATGLKNFVFYTSLALVLTVVGLHVLFDGAVLAASWTMLGVGTAILGGRLSRMTLFSHAALYLVGAAGVSGLTNHALRVLVGHTTDAIGWPPGMAVVVALAAGACALVTIGDRPGVAGRLRQLPRLALIVVFAFGLAAAGVDAIAWALGFGTGTPRMGLLATDRTAVLSVLALLTAWTSRWPRLAISGTLVYPVLIFTGLRLIVEDLRHSAPSTLFVAFGFYGAALIIAPRLKRERALPLAARRVGGR
ncbi:MAG: hypothetical protein AB1806_11260 [Acidobacteriota bacterium]